MLKTDDMDLGNVEEIKQKLESLFDKKEDEGGDTKVIPEDDNMLHENRNGVDEDSNDNININVINSGLPNNNNII